MPKIITDEQVFRAVAQVVIERGFAAATTREMAEAAQISEVTLFRKYGSKLELVKASIAHLAGEMEASVSAAYTGDLEADLQKIVESYQAVMEFNSSFLAVILSDIVRNPDLSESFSKPLQLFREIGLILKRYQEDGRLKREEPLHAAASLLGPLMYTSLMHLAMSAEIPPFDPQSHIQAFLNGRQL